MSVQGNEPDLDLIARLYADRTIANDLFRQVIRDSLSRDGTLLPDTEPKLYSRNSRASTPTTEGSTYDQESLQLRFSSDLKRREDGFVFGASRTCDVVLPDKFVSRRHFAIAFDEQARLVVRDLGSMHGTAVEYRSGAGATATSTSTLRRSSCIIGGTPEEVCGKTITISLKKSIRIIVEVQPFFLNASHFDRVAHFQQPSVQAYDLVIRTGNGRNP